MSEIGCCSDCKFWNAFGNAGNTGECRRRAPKVFDQIGKCWPQTNSGDWCGEFQPPDAEVER